MKILSRTPQSPRKFRDKLTECRLWNKNKIVPPELWIRTKNHKNLKNEETIDSWNSNKIKSWLFFRCFIRKEKKPRRHEPLTKDLGVCTNTIPDVIEGPAKVVKCTKFALESERLEFEDEGFLKNSSGPLQSEYAKEKFVKSIREPEATRCQPEEKKSKRKMSPCARIKRFIDSQKRRSLRREKEKESKKRKRKKKCLEKVRVKNEDVEKISAQAEKGSNKNVRRNFETNSSPRNREKRGPNFRTHEKTLHRSKLIGCTCDMCRLFQCQGRTKIHRPYEQPERSKKPTVKHFFS